MFLLPVFYRHLHLVDMISYHSIFFLRSKITPWQTCNFIKNLFADYSFTYKILIKYVFFYVMLMRKHTQNFICRRILILHRPHFSKQTDYTDQCSNMFCLIRRNHPFLLIITHCIPYRGTVGSQTYFYVINITQHEEWLIMEDECASPRQFPAAGPFALH